MNTTTLSSSTAASVSTSSSVASFSDVSSTGSQAASNVIFAADELDSVFRIGCSGNSSSQAQNTSQQVRESNMRRRRFISPSFATDGELSTFSEEDNDILDETEESSGSTGILLSLGQSNRRSIFYPSRRQRSPLSIFRSPISGSKRQCEDIMMSEDGDQVKSTPTLCRANCICGSNDSSDECSGKSSSEESLDQVMSTPNPKRACLGRNDSPSSYVSLFSVSSPATIDYRGADSIIITPKALEHPLASGRPLIES